MKRAHGAHNKQVCDRLHVEDKIKCNDWIVTTAFYSAIHYLDSIIFPIIYNGTKFEDINEAHKVIRKQSKHVTRGFLVNEKVPSQLPNYNYLMEECWNARYKDYDVNSAVSDLCVKKLDAIIKECNK